MRRFAAILAVGALFVAIWISGCTELDNGEDPDYFTPTPNLTINTPPPYSTPTPTPTGNTDGDIYTTEPGDRLEFSLGNRPSGTFFFEARGFVEERYPGDESWMKPVYFWIYNDNSGFDYNGSGFLFQVIQLMHAGYYCQGGKLHYRNHGQWLGEICYQFPFQNDQWYKIEIDWANNNISITIDGATLASGYTNSINGSITAGIGWPPTRREGIAGLQYRNYGFH